MTFSGAVLYALRRWGDRRRVGQRHPLRSLHVKLTGAMLLVLALDGGGYLLAVSNVSKRLPADIAALEDIFVAVALLTLSVGLILPGIIAHAAGEIARAADHLATGTLADLSRAMQALEAGDLDMAQARAGIVPVVVYTRDELGAMAASFNTMQAEIAQAAVALDGAREGLRQARDDLRASNAELARWGAELERRVEDRTVALQRRGEQLEAVLFAGQQLLAQQTPADLLLPVAEAAYAVARAAAVSAYMRSPDNPEVLERVALVPPDAAGAGPAHLPIPFSSTSSTDARDAQEGERVLLIPLEIEGAGIAGLLRLVDVPAAFGQEGRDVLAILATKAAIALENTRLLASEHEARAAAEAAVRVRDDFLTAASHDLRTPLTSIMGNADIIQIRLERDDAIDHIWLETRISALREATRRMVATVEEITDVAQLQIGRSLELRLEPVDVGEMVRAAASIVAASAPQRAAPVVIDAVKPVVVEGRAIAFSRGREKD